MSSFPDTYNELLFSRLTRYGDGPHLSNFDKFRDTAPLRSRFLSIFPAITARRNITWLVLFFLGLRFETHVCTARPSYLHVPQGLMHPETSQYTFERNLFRTLLLIDY